MKLTRGSFYTFLLGVAVAIPLVGHTVTLPTANRTPCIFGALGSPSACARAADTSAGMARTMPQAVTPQATATQQVGQEVPVSSILTSSGTPAEVSPAPTTVASVPLPLAGGLLLGSLGLMVVAVRKSRR